MVSLALQFSFISVKRYKETNPNILLTSFVVCVCIAANDTVRVKHLHSRMEEDVAASDVARFLQSHIMMSTSGRATLALRTIDDEGEAGTAVVESNKDRRRREKR